MREAVLGGLLGLFTGGLSVWSLWLITGFTARAATGLHVESWVDRPTGWDKEWDGIDDEEKGIGRFFRKPESEIPSPTVSPSDRASFQAEPSSEAPPPAPPHRPLEDDRLLNDFRRGDEEGGLRAATFRVFFAFLLKAPILYAIARVAQSLGNVGLHWCVGGVVLVYFLAVFYAARRTNRR